MQRIIAVIVFPVLATRFGVFGHDTIYYKGTEVTKLLSQNWILFDTVTYTTQEANHRSYHIRPQIFTQNW